MPRPPKRDAPELFDRQWAEHPTASARSHIEELREHLGRRRREEASTAGDGPSGVTRRHHDD